jgi:hypothetical protein
MTNYFTQYGTLSLAGGATVSAQGNVYINGTVITVPGRGMAPATLSTAATLDLVSGASGTASITGSAGSGLVVDAGAFDDGGLLNAGTTTTISTLTINTGNFVEDPTGVIDVWAASTLTFQTGGNPSAQVDLKGQLNLYGTGATVNNAQTLWIDGGTLTATENATITGNLSVYNGGSATVGNTNFPITLTMSAGSLTIGAQAPGLSATGGTLNLDAGSTLTFPAAGSVTSTFQVDGGPGAPGILNMFGAAVTMSTARVASLDLENGVLNSDNGSIGMTGFFDTITGNLNNAGTVQFGAALHTLIVTDNYTQTEGGTLVARLANLGVSDGLAVGGSAALDGTLNLTAQGNLTAGDTWTVVAYGTLSGDFATVNFPPDGNPAWAEAAGVVTN